MLTIRIDNETKEMIAYLKNHNIRYTDIIREAIRPALKSKCQDMKKKEKRIKNAPDWVYE